MDRKLVISLYVLGLLTFFLVAQIGWAGTGRKAVHVKIPPKYRGYGLRISGQHYELDQPTVKVLGTASRRRIELSDADNRLMADSFTRVGPDSLATMRERPLQAGVELGFGYEAGTDKFKKLKLRGATYHTGANIVYRPKAYGLMLNYNHLRFDGKRLSGGARSDFQSDRLGIGAVYEWAPVGEGAAFFARLHLAIMIGATWARHKINISEDDVELTDSVSSVGPQGAIELRIPLVVNLWLALRETYSSYRLNFADLNFDYTVQELNSSVGVRYAF